jgi:hypothetical protein
MRDFLQTAGASVGITMIGLPATLEIMPIAAFQSGLNLLLWYAVGFGIVGLVGWSISDEDIAAAQKEREVRWEKPDGDNS